MSNKTVYLKGKSHYARPYFRDMGETANEDHQAKILRTDGQYNMEFLLVDPDTGDVFTSKDDASDYLKDKGVPVENLFGNFIKRDPETKEVRYKVTRPHMEPNMPKEKGSDERGFVFGPPKVVDADGKTWNEETLIGNGSDITVKINVWRGDKATKIRWDGVRVDSLVEYEPEDSEGF